MKAGCGEAAPKVGDRRVRRRDVAKVCILVDQLCVVLLSFVCLDIW
jgi:hypothetical protein